MWRSFRIVLLACVLPIATALPAAATSHSDPASSLALSALWSKVFQTPSPQNPFGDGGVAATCLKLAPRVVSPFGPSTVPGCTVDPGTTLVVTPWTYECSTFEGSTVAQLRECAKTADAGITKVTLSVDQRAIATNEVETILIPIVLPADNIFGVAAGSKGFSVGHGWVAILKPLRPGTHTVHLTASGTNSSGAFGSDVTTIIKVRS